MYHETLLTQPKLPKGTPYGGAAQPSNEIQSTKYYVRIYQKKMQNKPNFKDAQMNVNQYNTKKYEKFIPLAGYKNKPNSNPIKPNFKRAKMNANVFIIKDYRQKDDFSVRINKPNSRKTQNERKRFFTKGL